MMYHFFSVQLQYNIKDMGKNQNKFIWLKGRFYHQLQILIPQISEELNQIIQIEYLLSKYKQRLENKIKSTYVLSQTHCQQWDKISVQNKFESKLYYESVVEKVKNLIDKRFIDDETIQRLRNNTIKLSMRLKEFQRYIKRVLVSIKLSFKQKIVWFNKDLHLKAQGINQQEKVIIYYGEKEVQELYQQYYDMTFRGSEI